jgi:hypothetical protein
VAAPATIVENSARPKPAEVEDTLQGGKNPPLTN